MRIWDFGSILEWFLLWFGLIQRPIHVQRNSQGFSWEAAKICKQEFYCEDSFGEDRATKWPLCRGTLGLSIKMTLFGWWGISQHAFIRNFLHILLHTHPTVLTFPRLPIHATLSRSAYCLYNTLVAFSQTKIHLAYDQVGQGDGCPRDAVSFRKGPTYSDFFASVQYTSERPANWTATFGPGPKKPQRLQPSIAEKGHKPSHVPQRKRRYTGGRRRYGSRKLMHGR